MILDTLSNSERYGSLHPLFPQAFAFLHQLGPASPPRTDLTDELYAMISRDQGKKPDEALLEAHRKYIDIHCCLEGRESIGSRPLSSCSSPVQTYDPEKDWMTFSDPIETWLMMTPGLFAIFFPEDAHATMVSEGFVRKCIMKVAANR